MAEYKLSDKLKSFKESYDNAGNLDSMSSDFSAELMTISNELGEAAANFNNSGNDAVISSIVGNTTLAKDGVDRIKSRIDEDIPGLLSGLKEVRALVKNIEDAVEAIEGNGGLKAQLRSAQASTAPDQGRIDSLNSQISSKGHEIDNNNQKGEAQLLAIKSAIDGVSFGVSGNMHTGGSLDSGSKYNDLYNFTWEDIPESVPGTGAPASTVPTTTPGSTPPTVTAEYDDRYRVVRNIDELKAALTAGEPVKLVANFRYNYHYGFLGIVDTLANWTGVQGWEVYEASEEHPLYLDKEGNTQNWVVLDGKNGTKMKDGKYSGMFLERNQVLNDPDNMMYDGNLEVQEGSPEADQYVTVTNIDELRGALLNNRKIKLVTNLHYHKHGGFWDPLANLVQYKSYEEYIASPDQPLYLVKDGNLDNWIVVDENGNRVEDYKNMWLEKKWLVDSCDSSTYDNPNLYKK